MKDNFWTVERIAETFQKDFCKEAGCGKSDRVEMTSVDIKNKVKKILKDIDCPESIFRRRAKKQDGHFIFKADDSVPDRIRRIFEFYDLHYDKICGSFMSNEESALIGMLFDIRPIIRQKSCNNTYTEYRRELKEFYVKKYLRIYKKELFVKVKVKDGKPSKCVRSNIYFYQTLLVKKWYEKWSYIMKLAMALRINERILVGYICGLESRLPEAKKRKRFYLEGFRYDELEEGYLKEKRLNEKEIYDACCDLYYYQNENLLENVQFKREQSFVFKECYEKCVSYVEKILSHSLQEVSIEDYLYIQRKAKEELEDIHKEVKEELLVEKGYENTVSELNRILTMVKEGGLKGKKNKRLEEILDASTGEIDWQDMIIDEIVDIRESIKCIVKGENDYSVLKRKVADFCKKEIETYNYLMKLKTDRRLTWSEYKKYFTNEMRKIEIGKVGNEEAGKTQYRKEVGELINTYCETLVRTRIKYNELRKEEMLITDFLPKGEKKKYWGIREYYTGRELI